MKKNIDGTSGPRKFNSVAQAICDKKFAGNKGAYLESLGYSA